MDFNFNQLSKIQIEILKNRILNQPNRPFGYSFNALYGDLDIAKYSEDEIRSALEELVTKKFVTKEESEDIYIFSRDQFLTIRSHFKWKLKFTQAKKRILNFLKWIWKYFIITVLTAVLTAYITTLVTMKIKSSSQTHMKEKKISANSGVNTDGKQRVGF